MVAARLHRLFQNWVNPLAMCASSSVWTTCTSFDIVVANGGANVDTRLLLLHFCKHTAGFLLAPRRLQAAVIAGLLLQERAGTALAVITGTAI
jgi:hypothetical protein